MDNQHGNVNLARGRRERDQHRGKSLQCNRQRGGFLSTARSALVRLKSTSTSGQLASTAPNRIAPYDTASEPDRPLPSRGQGPICLAHATKLSSTLTSRICRSSAAGRGITCGTTRKSMGSRALRSHDCLPSLVHCTETPELRGPQAPSMPKIKCDSRSARTVLGALKQIRVFARWGAPV